MKQRRKTIPTAAIVDAANVALAAPGATREGRIAIAVVLAGILMDHDAYRGFQYLATDHLLADDCHKLATTEDVHAGNYDDTRRRYY